MGMPLERQVVSLDLSRQLKELGVKQEAAFYWKHKAKHFCGNDEIPDGEAFLEPTNYTEFPEVVDGAAFTVAELGEMLPWLSGIGRLKAYKNSNGDWACEYSNSYKKEDDKTFRADTEADARAKMLIHLIKQGIVTPKKEGGE
jgi:hypothetical protein